MIDLNATQAAIRAGYSKIGATVRGSELLANRNVAAALAERQKVREEKTGIDAAWVIRRLKREAELEGDGASHAARISALGLAAKHLGMLKEDAPHPDRVLIDFSKLADDALDKLLLTFGPLVAPGLLPGGDPGEVPQTPTD